MNLNQNLMIEYFVNTICSVILTYLFSISYSDVSWKHQKTERSTLAIFFVDVANWKLFEWNTFLKIHGEIELINNLKVKSEF